MSAQEPAVPAVPAEPPPPDLARVATVLLLLAALVLAVVVCVQALPPGAGDRLEAGSRTPLAGPTYGREATVLVPGVQVDVTVGEPVDELSRDLLDRDPFDDDDPLADGDGPVAAPEGGALLPVGWQVRDGRGLGAEADPEPVDVVLVAGEERIDLDSVRLGGSASLREPSWLVLALDDAVSTDELSVEVTYDGLTQVLDVATGEVDAGAAAPLYDPVPSLTTGCAEVEDRCDLRAADPGSPLRPSGAGYTVGGLSFYAYDRGLGWAEEGTVWASAYVSLFDASGVETATGRFWSSRGVRGVPRVTLDGREPVATELEASAYSVGSVEFSVPVDDVDDLRALRIQVDIALPRSAPADTLPAGARLPLRPA